MYLRKKKQNEEKKGIYKHIELNTFYLCIIKDLCVFLYIMVYFDYFESEGVINQTDRRP